MKRKPLHYGDYLDIEKLISCGKLQSQSHDEQLFILVHQAYELWFKQMLWELDSVLKLFTQKYLPEKDLNLSCCRLERVIAIQKLIVGQLDILETMTPLDFMEFRDLLIPASGFQSVQFRLLEIKLGLRQENRIIPENFIGHLNPAEQAQVRKVEAEPSLLERVQNWLERFPFDQWQEWNFWEVYQERIQTMLQRDQKIIQELTSPEQKSRQQQIQQQTKRSFESLFDTDVYQTLQQEKHRKFSQNSFKRALFIHLYRDEPLLQLPFRFLNALKDIDEQLSSWRYRHSLMAQRFLGTKIGTGGSSGHQYLRQTSQHHRIFVDLFDLPTFFLPRSELPTLPLKVKQAMNNLFQENCHEN